MDLFEYWQRAAYAIKGDNRYKLYDSLNKNLLLSRDELINLQNSYIQNIVLHAYNQTEYYNSLFKKYDINPNEIKQLEDLKRIPPITKTIIRNNLQQFISKDYYGNNLMEVSSGGTTGEQGLIFISPFYMQMSAAFALRSNYIAGWNPSDKWVALRTVMTSTNPRRTITTNVRNYLNRVTPLNALAYSSNHFQEWVKLINSFNPKIIYGFSSVLLSFSKYLIENEIYLPSIKIPISTSEVLLEPEIIQKAFKANVINQYGSREIMALGLHKSSYKNMLIFDDNIALNQMDNNELHITALHSYGFPLINYKIGDKGEVVNEIDREESEFPFSQMKLTIGRITDNFISSKKIYVASSSIITHLANFKLGVLEKQIIQTSYEEFIVNYIPDTNINPEFENIIYEVLRTYFGRGIKITFNQVDQIPLEKSGKKIMYKRTFIVN